MNDRAVLRATRAGGAVGGRDASTGGHAPGGGEAVRCRAVSIEVRRHAPA
jgi:hypothetical protein